MEIKKRCLQRVKLLVSKGKEIKNITDCEVFIDTGNVSKQFWCPADSTKNSIFWLSFETQSL